MGCVERSDGDEEHPDGPDGPLARTRVPVLPRLEGDADMTASGGPGQHGRAHDLLEPEHHVDGQRTTEAAVRARIGEAHEGLRRAGRRVEVEEDEPRGLTLEREDLAVELTLLVIFRGERILRSGVETCELGLVPAAVQIP